MPPIFLGVAGGSGSGKTTIVDTLKRELGDDRASIIEHDSYYRDRSDVPPEERGQINYDHPDALETSLLVNHLHELRAGRAVEVPRYDFARHTRKRETVTVHARSLVMVEGILLLADPSLRDLLDIRVFVDADADLRLLRRVERDLTERDRTLDSVIKQYLDTVRPMHLEFVEPSKQWAHLIIPGGGRNRVGVEALLATVLAKMGDDLEG